MPNQSDSFVEATPVSTLLSFSGIGVPPFSARGLTQILAPIDIASSMRRTINGSLKDLSVSQFHKYKSTIATGQYTDQQPPAVSGAWPGKVIAVNCIAELCYESDGSDIIPERAAVPGSIRTDGDFTFYRPILTMRVVSYAYTTDEWNGEVSWTMDLEEV